MDATTLKTSIVNKLHKISDKRILQELDSLVEEMHHSESADFWNELSPKQKEIVELSQRQVENEDLIPHNQVQQEARERLKR